jgi:ABC-2 type transport system ATP-binding protein
MPAIEVTGLQKIFQTKRKAAGMRGSVGALFKPEYSSIEAVRRLTFHMAGNRLWPNGAGKSTPSKC